MQLIFIPVRQLISFLVKQLACQNYRLSGGIS